MLNGIISFNPDVVKKLLNTLLVLVGLIILSLVLFTPYIPDSISINQGDITKQTITSPRYITFESKQDKEQNYTLKTNAINTIGKIYTIDPMINQKIKEKLYAVFNSLTLQKKK